MDIIIFVLLFCTPFLLANTHENTTSLAKQPAYCQFVPLNIPGIGDALKGCHSSIYISLRQEFCWASDFFENIWSLWCRVYVVA